MSHSQNGKPSWRSKVGVAMVVSALVSLAVCIQTILISHRWYVASCALVVIVLCASLRMTRRLPSDWRRTSETHQQWESWGSEQPESSPSVGPVVGRRRLRDLSYPREWGRSVECGTCGAQIFWDEDYPRHWYAPKSYPASYHCGDYDSPPHDPMPRDPLARLVATYSE